MTIIEWLDSLSDLPGHHLLEMMKRDIDEIQQLNNRTSVKFVESYRYHLPMMPQILAQELEAQYKTIRIKKRIQEWSYRGFKAVMWRIWGAILEDVPEHGYEIIERKEWANPIVETPNYQTREFTMKEYGIRGWGLEYPVRLVFFYDPMTDTLYTRKDFARGWL